MKPTDPIDEALEHHRAGRLDEAARLARKALAKRRDDFNALQLLGAIAYQRNDDPEAIRCLERATSLVPGHAGAVKLLGMALMRQGRAEEAVVRFRRAAELDPNQATTHAQLADALHMLGRRAEAVEPYRQAVALAPDNAEAWWGLGCVLEALGNDAGAADAFRRLIALDPNHGHAYHNLGRVLFKFGQVDDALGMFAAATERLGSNPVTQGNVAAMVPGCQGADHAAVLEARRAWGSLACPSPARPQSLTIHSSDRPLRLGYVSGFFAERNWMKPVWGLINHHDREQFEIHLFSDAPESRIEQGYAKDRRDVFHDTTRLSNDDFARLVTEHGIDVLIDLNAYSRPGRLPLFALRPAPVAVAWFNMFATSGLDVFDALIGDAHVIRAEEEPYYSEPIVRVPGSYLTFEVGYPVPDVAPAPSLETGWLTFGCLGPQYKITNAVIAAWARILEESPGTRLLVKNVVLGQDEARSFLRDQFRRFEIDPSRVDLEGPAEHYTFLEAYAKVDIALDTFPYNGGTTTMEALWQGVPVLTFDGDRWASRISASLLRSAGLPEFVTPDLDSFVNRALEFARDPAAPHQLNTLRGSLRDRLRRSSVCDCVTFARNMEGIYRDLWRRKHAATSS